MHGERGANLATPKSELIDPYPTLAVDCLTGRSINLVTIREKPLFLKRCWRVSTYEDEMPLKTYERGGGDEAGRAERPIAATLEDGPQADLEAEETSLPGATVG
ncbi:hypothetical protein E2C01_052975 [Portunus trituberculatus]|uniref:Uncharacterized protein n=1 Tax=Portunus trituberculatus TaxID=210409 RepID=A0A5B7GF67_PORTR|nr:hypothetical protein [Portunus trituberculatus]